MVMLPRRRDLYLWMKTCCAFLTCHTPRLDVSAQPNHIETRSQTSNALTQHAFTKAAELHIKRQRGSPVRAIRPDRSSVENRDLGLWFKVAYVIGFGGSCRASMLTETS
eukprot:1434595-Rhodomonas_salina.2